MPYGGNPATDATDAIRLLIGDTSTSTGSEIFSDGEIDWFDAQTANTYLAAEIAIVSVIGSTRGDSLARIVTEKQVGDLKLKYATGSGDISSEVLRSKARQLHSLGVRQVKPYAGGISKADKRTQEDIADRPEPWAKIGQHDYDGHDPALDSWGER